MSYAGKQLYLPAVDASGGEATLLEAALIDALDDAEVEELFGEARDADYACVAAEARELEKHLPDIHADEELRRQGDAELERLEWRLEEIRALDFFGASGRESAGGLVAALRARLTPPELLTYFAKNRTETLPR